MAPPAWRSTLVWAVAALFYLSGFYLRVSPAVMTTELMRDFGIAATALGNFSAVYFYAYLVMQIPTGVLVDSWGARRLLLVGIAGAAAGTLLFATTSSYLVACIGRGMVGGSTAVAWVVTLKLATHWFPGRLFTTLAGLGLFMGNLGALVAQVPLRLAVDAFGWRAVAVGSAGVIIVIAVLAFAFVRNDPSEVGYESCAPASLRSQHQVSMLELLRGFSRIFGYRNTWLIFCAQGGFVGAVLSFTGLWGPPYLRARFGVPPTTAAAICSVMIVCWAVASPVIGNLTDRLGRRKPIYLGGAVTAALGWLTMFYVPLPLPVFVAVAAVTSVACGAVIIGFPFAKESVPAKFLATISGAINFGNMLGPTLLQPAIGLILDHQWDGRRVNGLRVYDPAAFQVAFLLIVGWALVACVLIALTRDTECQQRE